MIQLTWLLEAYLAFLAAWSPGCVATQREFLVWGTPGSGLAVSDAVPTGKVWFVRAGGVSTTDNTGGEYMMELIRPVASQGGVCCWRIPVERTPGWTYGTPVLALHRPLVMMPGERLGSRENGADPTSQISIEFVYYELPASCLLGVQIDVPY